MRTLLTVILTYQLSLMAFSQENVIKGIVRDAETKEEIPFAHVVLGKMENVTSSHDGTLTDIDGKFQIEIGDTKSSILQVSVMGYDLTEVSLAESADFLEVDLNPSVVHLEDVTVRSGEILMDQVYKRFHLNYEVESHHVEGYYNENLGNDDSLYYVAEGIVDIYVPSNVDFDQPLVSPIRTRKKIYKEVNDHLLLEGNASDMSSSSIWRRNSFLGPKKRKHYDHFYEGIESYEGQEVFVVEFEPKTKKGHIVGKIYINKETLAILKLEYHPVTEKTFWDKVMWVEKFDERDGIFELSEVSYSGTWTEYDETFTFQAVLIADKLTKGISVPKGQYLLKGKHTFYDVAHDELSEDDFWDGFQHIKNVLDDKIMAERKGYFSSVYSQH